MSQLQDASGRGGFPVKTENLFSATIEDWRNSPASSTKLEPGQNIVVIGTKSDMLKILQFCLLMFCTAVSIGTSPNFYSWLLPYNDDVRASKLSLLQGLNRPAVRLSFSLLL